MKKSISKKEIFWQGFLTGVSWSFGATVGFAIISTLIVLLLNYLGGLPVVGSFIANIVEATQQQLMKRTFLLPN